MKKSLLIVALAVTCLFAEAQVVIPAASPKGSVSTTVGLTDIRIDYSRPRAKGRKIFGDGNLVPYGRIWRTGANNGTKISFSDDVKVEGIAVPQGEYLIFTWPGASEWTVSLYKDLTIGGDVSSYDKSKEAANFKVKSIKLADKVETFTMGIADIADDSKSANVKISWENTAVKFKVTVDFDAKVMASIQETTAKADVDANSLNAAATYYLENGKDLKQALQWATTAAEKDPKAYWIWYGKARIQAALKDKKGATESATTSMKAAAAANNKDYEKMTQDFINTLK